MSVTAEQPAVQFLPESGPVNRQLYPNSPLAGSSVEDGVKTSPDKFFNSKPPNFAILHEKPEHRIILMLKARGHSNTEIAAITGYTMPWVSQVLRQPWARERLVEELRRLGSDEVSSLLQSAAIDSVFRIIELRDTSTEDSVRLRASQDLLDRHLGKATQKIESRSTSVLLTGELEDIDREIARLREQEARLLGMPTGGSVIDLEREPAPAEEPAWTEAKDKVSAPPAAPTVPTLEDYQ